MSYTVSRTKKNAFTLIELLIVVAIIAILAAIAVPNFLDAQIRAKVSRVKNDLRTIATGMEAYIVDHNQYPGDSLGEWYEIMRNMVKLTTPVAYLTSLPTDPFHRPNRPSPLHHKYYSIGSGSDNRYVPIVQCYHIICDSPHYNKSVRPYAKFPFSTDIHPYDPTNGTRSYGDIYRFGGDYTAGNWTIFDIDHRQWNVTASMPE